MNLFHLRYFLTLARLEHYTRAADELMITQPSLSHAISALESELGVKLFEKVGRNIKLTKYGMAFQAGVEGSLRQLDACVNSLKLTGSGEGLIELGFVRAIGTDFVPRMVSMFLQHMPIKTLKLESPGWQRLFYIATLKDYYLAPVVERFRQFVMDHAEL